MKPIARQSDSKTAFTIVELLTVMSIVIILIGLLVPGLNMAKRFARKVTQKNQFHSLDAALELFNAEWEGYPDSGAKDPEDNSYCGAMKLCEAMVGKDLKGFHPDSLFRHDGLDGSGGNDLYPDVDSPSPEEYKLNIQSRNRPFLQLESANAYELDSISEDTGPFDQIPGKDYHPFVLCDEYTRVTNIGDTGPRKIGMPILYYKADISKIRIYTDEPTNEENIYDFKDNDELVQLALPWSTSDEHHPMDSVNGDAAIFYKKIANDKIAVEDITDRPYRADSYILMSAGYDGEYGTPDDIFNFNK